MDKYLISLYQSGKGKYILYVRGFFSVFCCLRNNSQAWFNSDVNRDFVATSNALNNITCEHKSLDIRHRKLAMRTNDSLFAILICNFILQSLLLSGRFFNIHTGVIGDTFPARSAAADIDSFTLQRGIGHLGTLHLFARALCGLVSLWLEVLQGQERQQLNQQ